MFVHMRNVAHNNMDQILYYNVKLSSIDFHWIQLYERFYRYCFKINQWIVKSRQVHSKMHV